MLTQATPLVVSERRPRPWGTRRATERSAVATDVRRRAKRATLTSKKTTSRRTASDARAPEPEGWQRRVREQSHNLARAVEMLEQAVGMMNESRAEAPARAESLRAAALITMLSAAELLVIAGWFEADQAVKGGTLDP